MDNIDHFDKKGSIGSSPYSADPHVKDQADNDAVTTSSGGDDVDLSKLKNTPPVLVKTPQHLPPGKGRQHSIRSTGSSYVSYGSYTMSDKGLYVEGKKGRGEDTEIEKQWISGAFQILGASRSPDGSNWGKVVIWFDEDRRFHFKHITDSALQGDPAVLAASLADEGLRIKRSQRNALCDYLCGVSVDTRVSIVPCTGWHTVGGSNVFVLPDSTIGETAGEKVILDGLAIGPYETRGSLKDWQHDVASPAADHLLVVLAISAALSGPLLKLATQDGGGIHFYGPSSKGKSTLLQASASVWGRGGSPGYVRAWRATANGLEGAAASASDTALVLDELGVIESREFSSAVYALSNGTGKSRAARDGSLREPKTWCLMVISSGEITTAAKLAEERGRRPRAGQMIRLLDVPADRGFGYGVFDNAGPDADAAALAKRFKVASQTAYGTAGPEFVSRLIEEQVDGEAIRALVGAFVSSVVPPGSDGQVDRAAQRLGIIVAAGELATELGVTPWEDGVARAAATWAFQRWLESRGGVEPHEVQQAIRAVRLIIEQHGEARFDDINASSDIARPVNNRLGWRKGDGEAREWWIAAEVWKTEVCVGLDPKFVARTLGERGMLHHGGDGWLSQRRIDGRNTRVYVITSAILDGATDAN